MSESAGIVSDVASVMQGSESDGVCCLNLEDLACLSLGGLGECCGLAGLEGGDVLGDLRTEGTPKLGIGFRGRLDNRWISVRMCRSSSSLILGGADSERAGDMGNLGVLGLLSEYEVEEVIRGRVGVVGVPAYELVGESVARSSRDDRVEEEFVGERRSRVLLLGIS